MAKYKPQFRSSFMGSHVKRDKKSAMSECSRAELYVREAFLRTVHEIADASGLSESYAQDKLRGLVDFLENWSFMERDIERM